MLMDEDGSENNQVKVATLLVSQLFSCWQNQGGTKDSSLFVKGKREREEEGGRKRREENGVDSEKKKKETDDGEQERETQRGAGGSRKQSYDVWMLASLPAKCSSTRKPASLPNRLRVQSVDLGLPGADSPPHNASASNV